MHLYFSSKRSLICGISIAGCAIIAYSIYFDYKRRTAKDYKNKIRLKRRMKETNINSLEINRQFQVDYTQFQQFFLQEVQLGEEMLSEGFVQEGLDHLAMAIVLCNKPSQVMTIFRQTLSEEHFNLLIESVPRAKQKFVQMIHFENTHST